MSESMARKVVHKITGTRKGITLKVTIEAPASFNAEPLADKIEEFIKNQIDSAVPKEQTGLDLKDGKAAAAGSSGE